MSTTPTIVSSRYSAKGLAELQGQSSSTLVVPLVSSRYSAKGLAEHRKLRETKRSRRRVSSRYSAKGLAELVRTGSAKGCSNGF